MPGLADLGGIMVFRAKGQRSRPLRYFVYISDMKVQMLLDQLSEPTRRSLAAELKLDFKLVSLTLTSPMVDGQQRQQSRIAKLAVVEDYIRRNHPVGDLASTRGYIAANAEMDWKPLDDNETVLFCGCDEKLLIVLGGSVSHLIGHPSSPAQLGSHPHAIRAAMLIGPDASPGDLGQDLEAAAQAVCSTPQPVRFLARVISRGPLGGDSRGEYLLATPLFVEAIDQVNSLEILCPRVK
jgi:hypothetical protein